TFEGVAQKQGRKTVEADLSCVRKGALVVENGKVLWSGEEMKIPKALLKKKKVKEISLKGKTVLPAFTECHTHLIFAGNRSEEFELRNTGVSYQEIAARGGGILSTMKATRAASPRDLLQTSQERVNRFVEQGVTCLEVKSGYALDAKNEIKVLEVAKKLKGPLIVSTFLGAHAKAPEFEKYEEYLDFLISDVLPEVAKKKLSSRADIFIEKGFFEGDSAFRYLKKAQDLGFSLTIHADQLSLSGGTEMALKLGAVSADHVIQVDSPLIKKMASSNLTAVCLPAADLYMKCAYPKAREMIDTGVRVALATDYNPGTSPTQDLALVGLLARLEMKMSLPEVWSAYTVGAAHALNLENSRGALTSGRDADFLCSEDSWKNFFYQAGCTPISSLFRGGRQIYARH
ncbi:MAG: imidazolonepropionase, partial [Pseudobdellovibrionaceae bacterium]